MTTREPKQTGKARSQAGASKQSAKRMKRPAVERTKPDRSGRSAAETAARNAERLSERVDNLNNKSRDTAPDIQIDDAIAEAVKSSYEVLAQTIAQGRAASARFREGDYNIREVPRDFETMAQRLLDLARQMSTATFDLCEQMLRQVSSAAEPPPPGEVGAGIPAFRSLKDRLEEATKAPSVSGKSGEAPEPARGSGALELKVTFSGKPNARCLVCKMQRPAKPTGPWQLNCAPLTPRSGDAAPLTDVKFFFDLARDSLTATVNTPEAQSPGVYSGLVFAETQDLPLGMLVVEVRD